MSYWTSNSTNRIHPSPLLRATSLRARKIMKFLFLSLFAAGISNAAEECQTLPETLEASVNLHIQTMRAYEHCEARKLQSTQDVSVVIYTAEGACSNDSTQEPSACSNNWDRYMTGEIDGKVLKPIRVGGRAEFADSQIKITGAIVELSGFSVSPNDPLCCPSVLASKKYRATSNGFEEIPP
jgi:hypothetical protein